MRKVATYFKDNFDSMNRIDYGVFIIFFMITMLFVLTVVKNF